MPKIEKLRQIELEILEQFIEICEREGLKWFVSHGTLLGTVRENGFLLWDDDIDIAMPLEDYNRLIANKEWVHEDYYMETPLDNHKTHKIRIFKKGTTAFDRPLHEVLTNDGYYGICIDVLPLNEVYDTGYYNLSKTILPKEYFESTSKASFEHLQVNVPNGARKVLDAIYGYWSWPIDAEKSTPKNWFFDPNVDFSTYIERYTGWLKASENKKVYLFGAGDSFRIWLRDFAYKNQVVCTFDNDRNKWGNKAHDVDIRNPKLLPDLLTDDSIIIIASLWHKEIGKQLENMGISKYYVFLDNIFNQNRR